MEPSTQQLWTCTIPDCGRVFKTKSAAYRHKKAKHDGRTFECHQCKKVYAHKDSLRHHRFYHHPAPEESCGDSIMPSKKMSKTDTTDAGTSTHSDVLNTDHGTTMVEDMDLGMDNISIMDVLRPPSPASPLCRGYIKPPTTVPFKPSMDNYYGQETLRFLINARDNLPIPARVDLKPTDHQGSPKCDHFKQSCHAYKTLAEAIHKLEDLHLPKCCLRGPRDELQI